MLTSTLNLYAHPENSNIEDAIRENLSKLVHAHFVERCPAIEPLLAPPSEEELAAKKRGSRSFKVLTVFSVD